MSDKSNSKVKKVAVIAVHGVSDQQPFDSAREVANLLLNPTTNPKENYTPFYEKFIRMVVNPIPIIHKQQDIEKEQAENKAIDINFTKDRLAYYDESSVYQTICLEGEGKFTDINNNPVVKKVHIYEMYWADLSRLGTGFIRIFGELYQLIFHFSILGNSVINSAQEEFNKDTNTKYLFNNFKAFNKCHYIAVWLLNLPIPILNLYLLIVAFSSLPFHNSSYTKISGKLQEVNSNFCPNSHYQSDCFLQLLSDFSGSTLAPIALLVFAFTLIVAIWALFPAILTDVFPPSSKQSQNNFYSQNLGFWLSNGFKATVEVLFCCFGIVIPLLALLSIGLSFEYFFGWDLFTRIYSDLGKLLNIESSWLMNLFNNNLNRSILSVAVGVLTASAGTLIAFGSRLNKISLGLRGVLDAALDVDNYLRLYPKENTTRGQIFARYASLLKYLLNCKDSQQENAYDEIVIIAHSQGAVITADLLRFLDQYHHHLSSWLGTKESEIPNIYLFTMGSPIRQLYSFAFPHLYYWVYNSPLNNLSIKFWLILLKMDCLAGILFLRESISDTTPTLPDNSNPDPSELLGVKQWVNAYRSGDYIGRYLWRSPNDDCLWQKVIFPDSNSSNQEENISQAHDKTRREFCIGAGGHTHYWDETAPDIAYELDRLITEA